MNECFERFWSNALGLSDVAVPHFIWFWFFLWSQVWLEGEVHFATCLDPLADRLVNQVLSSWPGPTFDALRFRHTTLPSASRAVARMCSAHCANPIHTVSEQQCSTLDYWQVYEAQCWCSTIDDDSLFYCSFQCLGIKWQLLIVVLSPMAMNVYKHLSKVNHRWVCSTTWCRSGIEKQEGGCALQPSLVLECVLLKAADNKGQLIWQSGLYNEIMKRWEISTPGVIYSK